MKTVPNQKIVSINKEKCDKTHLYSLMNLEALEQAARALSAGAFKLWIYFAKNQNNYTFALSSSDVASTFGIKIRQYNNAIQELINAGYLVQNEGNKYDFFELPEAKTIEVIIHKCE